MSTKAGHRRAAKGHRGGARGTSSRPQPSRGRPGGALRATRSSDLLEPGLRRWRRGLVYVLLVVVPAIFETARVETFTLAKYTLVVVGAVALAGLLLVSWVADRPGPLLRSGFHGILLALVAWTAVATVTSVRPGISLVGFLSSRDGLLAALALAVVAVAVVDAVELRHLPRMAQVLWFGAAGPPILYGALQLHDLTTSWGGTWDFVQWGNDPNAEADWLFSTVGNPNDLAGFVAMLLPVGVALLFVRQAWWSRLVTFGLVGLGLAEVVYTTSRAAWIAVALGLALLGVLLGRELWARRRAVLAAGGAVAAAALMIVLAADTPVALPTQLGSIFDPQGKTTTERVEMWQAGWQMALDRPLVGWGPDTYRVPFTRYQSADYVRVNGGDTSPNGAHSTFFNRLASTGFPGLALFVALLLVVALRGAGAFRRLGQLAAARRPEHRPPIAEARVLLAGVLAAGLAYLIHASFNPEAIELNLVFWVLVGLIGGAALDVGVPLSLRPATLLATPPPDRAGTGADVPRAAGRERAEAAPSAAGLLTPRAVTASVLATVAALAAAWWLSAPYRAAGTFAQAGGEYVLASQLARDGNPDGARAAIDRSVDLYEQALALDRWSPDLHGTAAEILVRMGRAELKATDGNGRSADRAADLLRRAREHYRRMSELGGESAGYLNGYGEGLVKIAALEPRGLGDVTSEAISVYRRALAANPWSISATVALARLHEEQGDVDAAREVLTALLERRPRVERVRTALERLEAGPTKTEGSDLASRDG